MSAMKVGMGIAYAQGGFRETVEKVVAWLEERKLI